MSSAHLNDKVVTKGDNHPKYYSNTTQQSYLFQRLWKNNPRNSQEFLGFFHPMYSNLFSIWKRLEFLGIPRKSQDYFIQCIPIFFLFGKDWNSQNILGNLRIFLSNVFQSFSNLEKIGIPRNSKDNGKHWNNFRRGDLQHL